MQLSVVSSDQNFTSEKFSSVFCKYAQLLAEGNRTPLLWLRCHKDRQVPRSSGTASGAGALLSRRRPLFPELRSGGLGQALPHAPDDTVSGRTDRSNLSCQLLRGQQLPRTDLRCTGQLRTTLPKSLCTRQAGNSGSQEPVGTALAQPSGKCSSGASIGSH